MAPIIKLTIAKEFEQFKSPQSGAHTSWTPVSDRNSLVRVRSRKRFRSFSDVQLASCKRLEPI